MRTLLLLALLLYDVVFAGRFYDYDDENRRHAMTDDRRNWRKKALSPSNQDDHKDWDDREPRRRDYDGSRYLMNELDRGKELDQPEMYRQHDVDKFPPSKSSEVARFYDKEIDDTKQPSKLQTLDKDAGKKVPMNCDRDHERYEGCFAGCAAVSCDNPRDRLHPCYPFCEPGCICVHPFVRDDRTHKCVMPEECTRGLKGIPDLGDGDDSLRNKRK